ncbi:gluconokinase [Frigoribacterium sp. Leaf172]|uniref:gluconokinase n=1 Tax=Frigoribacterium sp. Leaf172 TaxID=1736285 RepID=UPI0007002531|nr:gluconokinase [Frigoribacterium sp. Leaf172]KQR62397.1 carbohydrate kinase [Frigoribacterium sp. Leaf172]
MAVVENPTRASSGPYAADPVLVVMGVSGSGKSTLAALLADELGWDLAEGDDLHPDENVAKMAAGTPLDDDDRAPWLDTVSSWIIEHALAGVPGVITCSALKRRYRDVLREHNVVFVYLRGTRELLGDRMAAREGHFMPTTLLDSQVATLEPPQADERHVVVDAGRAPADEVADVIRLLGLTRA